jgi:hypothetical protein
LFALSALIFFAGCGGKADSAGIPAEEGFSAGDLTLLERSYIDLNGDGEDESVELYTSAQPAPDGRMGWDTGHTWKLVARAGERFYPLFDEYLQYGELQYWLVATNPKRLDAPADGDLEISVYAAVTTGNDFKLLRFAWDERSAAYAQEIVANPSDQWFVRHSNKYNIPQADYTETGR